jgi:hypothetical protein
MRIRTWGRLTYPRKTTTFRKKHPTILMSSEYIALMVYLVDIDMNRPGRPEGVITGIE